MKGDKMAKRLSMFTVYARIEIDCGIDLKAESLADAVAEANRLRSIDFVEFLGECQNSTLKITGVLEDS